jgi:hypothetical protein
VIPAVIGLDQVVRPGIEGLRYLAGLRQRLPVPAGTGPGRGTLPAPIARAA